MSGVQCKTCRYDAQRKNEDRKEAFHRVVVKRARFDVTQLAGACRMKDSVCCYAAEFCRSMKAEWCNEARNKKVLCEQCGRESNWI